jgi:nucleoside 2-deoxyribosyltransferase
MVRVYVPARFKGGSNRGEIEALCAVVRKAGLEDFCFIRDVELYKKTFDDPVELWERARLEITNCDALVIDVSDAPSGGRVVEVGIAFAQEKPIVVLVKEGIPYKGLYDGVAKAVLTYEELEDVTVKLGEALKN